MKYGIRDIDRGWLFEDYSFKWAIFGNLPIGFDTLEEATNRCEELQQSDKSLTLEIESFVDTYNDIDPWDLINYLLFYFDQRVRFMKGIEYFHIAQVALVIKELELISSTDPFDNKELADRLFKIWDEKLEYHECIEEFLSYVITDIEFNSRIHKRLIITLRNIMPKLRIIGLLFEPIYEVR